MNLGVGEGVKAELAMIGSHPTLAHTTKRQLLNAVQEIRNFNDQVQNKLHV